MHEFYGSKSLWSVTHPINNEEFDELFVLYDPTHLFKNIRNNWVTEKTRCLKFVCPETGRNVVAKWSDLVTIYKEEQSSSIKQTNITYASLYPTNFEKQKVSHVLNIFNEKVSLVLNIFNEKVSLALNIFNEKVSHVLNIFNEKTVAALRHRKCDNTAVLLNMLQGCGICSILKLHAMAPISITKIGFHLH